MAVNEYIGWGSHINRIILSQTSISVGSNATVSDELQSGGKRTIKKGCFCPDVYSVIMEFNCDDKVSYVDGNGDTVTLNKTEYQLFIEWYKYKHKYGSVPFEFPKILYSPQSGIKSQDDSYGNQQVEFYKITSAVDGNKIGHCIQVKMTWESVFGGVVSITEETPAVKEISAVTPSYINILFSNVSDTEPVSSDFSVYIDNSAVDIKGFYFDGSYTVRLYYDEITESGTHTITFAINDYSGLTVDIDEFTVNITI